MIEKIDPKKYEINVFSSDNLKSFKIDPKKYEINVFSSDDLKCFKIDPKKYKIKVFSPDGLNFYNGCDQASRPAAEWRSDLMNY